ncbi:hypothetical protein [Streptomyces sp. NPDC058424]|uniref:hypothetical protein n=1 Tax=Streptomyces sp. NPDC058424 TaxID=3346491 RepID=UPI00365407D6
MRIRRILAAVSATAALAGLGLTGAATATAQGGGFTTPSQCREGGGQPYLHNTVKCWGGKYDGMTVD